ncbi:hypothetical protein B296_00020335 [Ensete ventricosum]|uniref:Uncharacterized protein n=1 Tax=Ensete ventricosum TaxID=4639 RepID=A0A427A7L6_ENSVE|nr:hypothetical protein B296_00020335 [Ensete ventricosum]
MAGAKNNNVVRKYNTRQCSRGKKPSPSSSSSSSGPSCYRGKKPSPSSFSDLSLGRSLLRKRHRTFEASKDECYPAKKHLGKKDDSSDSDVQILEDECVAEDAVEFGNEPKETPQHHHDPGSSQIADVKDLTGTQVNMFSGHVIVDPEENVPVEQSKTCVAKSVAEFVVEPNETPQHHRDPISSQIADVKDLTGPQVNIFSRLVIVEPEKNVLVERSKTCVAKGVAEFGTRFKETLQHHRDPGRLQIADVKDLTGPLVNMFSGQVLVEPKKNVPVEQSKTYVAHGILLDDQKTVETAGEQEEHKIKKIGLKGYSTPEVLMAILVASEVVACKFLLTEEGICHIVNDYEKNGLGAVTVTPICVSTTEICTCIDCNHSVTMSNDASCHIESVSEVNFHGPTKDYIETSNGMHTCEENGNAPGYLSGKDFSTLDGSVRSILQDIPGIDTQGNSSRYGDCSLDF